LVFGIGTATSAELEVIYPNGLVVTRTGLSINGAVNDVRIRPSIQESSIVASYIITSTSTNTFQFDFETIGDCDFVRIYFPGKAPTGACNVLPADKDLQPGDSGVSWVKTEVAPGVFHHTLSWAGVPCAYPCTYNFTIDAALLGETHASATHQLNISICGGFQE
jgi:hypothetical protein